MNESIPTDRHPAAGDVCLTVLEPFASLLVRGLKPLENRPWPTRYRGPLWVHAGKGGAYRHLVAARAFADVWPEMPAWSDLPLGCIVGRVDLYDCVRLEDLPAALRGHRHAGGPWCWLVRDAVRLAQPVQVKGSLRLWTYR